MCERLGLEVETLEKLLYVNSSIGTRVSIDKICWDPELEILGILLTVNQSAIDISDLDSILGIDGFTAHRVVIDCDRRRITAYTRDGVRVNFQREKHDASPQAVYDSRWHRQLMGWLASLTLEDEVRQDLSLPQVVCEYEDVFPNDLLGLPSHRVVDFVIGLHPGTSPFI